MYSTLNDLSIFDGVQSARETFSSSLNHPQPSSVPLRLCASVLKLFSHSISIFAHAKSGLPTSFGNGLAHAAHFSSSPSYPVISRSGSPQMRIARCLYGSLFTQTS